MNWKCQDVDRDFKMPRPRSPAASGTLAMLWWLLAVFVASIATAGCGAGSESAGPASTLECRCPESSARYPVSPDDGSPAAAIYGLHAADRAAGTCAFGVGDHSAHTISDSAPRPPSDFHVGLLLVENRSFDH